MDGWISKLRVSQSVFQREDRNSAFMEGHWLHGRK